MHENDCMNICNFNFSKEGEEIGMEGREM